MCKENQGTQHQPKQHESNGCQTEKEFTSIRINEDEKNQLLEKQKKLEEKEIKIKITQNNLAKQLQTESQKQTTKKSLKEINELRKIKQSEFKKKTKT